MTLRERADPAATQVRDLLDVARLAAGVLADGGISEPPTPENLVSLIDPGRRVVIEYTTLARGHHGMLSPDDLGWLILLNEKDHPLVQRVSLFHEGFHILRRSRGLLPSADYRYVDFLATAFARQVLIPREWLSLALKKTTDIRRLAGIFGVPRLTMAERLREMNR